MSHFGTHRLTDGVPRGRAELTAIRALAEPHDDPAAVLALLLQRDDTPAAHDAVTDFVHLQAARVATERIDRQLERIALAGGGQRGRPVRHLVRGRMVTGGVPATREFRLTTYRLLGLGGSALGLAVVVPIDAAALVALITVWIALAALVPLLRALAGLSPAAISASRRRPVRVAVVGPIGSAAGLRADLAHADVSTVEVVGAVDPDSPPTATNHPLGLGGLQDLGRIVAEHDVDLVLVPSGVSRSVVVDHVMWSCEGHAVRLCSLSGFYEDVFGRVPLSEIDIAWFEYVLHPRFRERRSQRVFDLIAGTALVLMFVPVLCIAALLIRLDGGPVFFRQVRVGQDGRPLRISKLRTMRWDADESARWASDDDPRVTRVGRLLRRTHVDELPQLLNVLRGEMSLVGPRPEQPEIAAHLEKAMPLWRGRYRHKPGITGWAQIRCGYARSEDGSAWKLAHDLYYLRHRSLMLDLAILIQTVVTVLVSGEPVDVPTTPAPSAPAALSPATELSFVGAPTHPE